MLGARVLKILCRYRLSGKRGANPCTTDCKQRSRTASKDKASDARKNHLSRRLHYWGLRPPTPFLIVQVLEYPGGPSTNIVKTRGFYAGNYQYRLGQVLVILGLGACVKYITIESWCRSTSYRIYIPARWARTALLAARLRYSPGWISCLACQAHDPK